jgi:hypothetical protein
VLVQAEITNSANHPLEVHMRTSPYFKRASKRFLTGTRFKTPCDAVEAGAKTLLEWTHILEEERSLEMQVMAQRARRYLPQHKRVARAIRV